MNWDMFWGVISSLGGLTIVLLAIDTKKQMKERNRAIEASWRAHKKEDEV